MSNKFKGFASGHHFEDMAGIQAMCSESKFNVSFYCIYSEIQLKSQWVSDSWDYLTFSKILGLPWWLRR